jgi:hypothetical protein
VRTSNRPGRPPRAALSSRLAIGFVLLAAVLSCHLFVMRGHPSSVDVWPHLARMDVVYHAVKEGFSPFYTFMFYSGFPVLRFYSPLFSFLGGALALLTGGNLLLALRVLLVLLHLLSAFVMYVYLLMRGRGGDKTKTGAGYGPALGAIVYLIIPWRTAYLAGSANYPEALVYVLMPLVFLAMEYILKGRSGNQGMKGEMPADLLLGLWVGLLFLAHLVYAIFTLLLLVVWWAMAGGLRQGARQWRALGAAVPAGIGVSAFFLIPFAVEQASHRFPITHLNLPVPDLLVLLGFKARVGGYGGVSLGLSVLLMLIVACGAVAFRRRFRFQIPALVGLAVSFVLTFAPALLKERQYLVTTGLPPERFLLFVVFFVSLLVPSAYELARGALSERGVSPGLVFAVMAVVAMLDCLLSTRHFSYPNRSLYMAVREEVYPIVRSEPHARLLDLDMPQSKIDDPARTSRLPTVGVVYGGLPTPLGLPYHQYAPRSMLHVYPWVSYIAGEIGDTSHAVISDDMRKALALMGVSHFMTVPTVVSVNGASFLTLKQSMDWDDRFVKTERRPPLAIGMTRQGLVLAANRVAPMAPDTLVTDHSFIVTRNWRRLLDTLQLDEQNHSLNFIPAVAGTAPDSMPGQPVLEIDSVRIRHPYVVTAFQVNTDCFVRLAVSYYPELAVTLDGRSVRFSETTDHFTYIRCPAGNHVLRVTAGLDGLRLVTLLLSLVSLPTVLVLILWRRRLKTTTAMAGTNHPGRR